MGEPVYDTVGKFAETYRFDRREVCRLIWMGVLHPRRQRGNSVLTETDMVRFVQWNTRQNEKNTRLTGR